MATDPERKRRGLCEKMAPYLVGHSSVSRRTWRVSCRPVRGPSSARQVSQSQMRRTELTSDVVPLDVRDMQLDVPQRERDETFQGHFKVSSFQGWIWPCLESCRFRFSF